jgi:hypothetical protein
MEKPMKTLYKKSLAFILLLSSVFCLLSSDLALAAGVEVSVVGTKVGGSFSGTWDIGLIKAAQTVYSCGTAPDVNCADTGDVYWTVTGSSNGQEDIEATVASYGASGNWDAVSSVTAANQFILKAADNDTLKLDETTPKTLYAGLPRAANFKLGLAFTSPNTGSNQGQQTMTITLTAKNWAHVFACADGITVNHVAGAVSPVTTSINYGTVSTNLSGATKCWITQNLGADSVASYVDSMSGWYWQFNRKQGYSYPDAGVRIPATAWDSTNDNTYTGWDPAKDPCALLLGTGWRLPTSAEWTNADSTGNWSSRLDAFNSVLRLNCPGYLYDTNAFPVDRGIRGYYWSSTQSDVSFAGYLYTDTVSSRVDTYVKSTGYAVRCLKD